MRKRHFRRGLLFHFHMQHLIRNNKISWTPCCVVYNHHLMMRKRLIVPLSCSWKVPLELENHCHLACASMAWLRHEEECDLNNNNNNNALLNNTDANGSNNNDGATGVDWLDSWVSPEESQNEELQKRVLQRARASRKALEDNLAALRDKLTPPSRERRENLVRSAVTTAKMMERKKLRKRPRTTTKKAPILQQQPQGLLCHRLSIRQGK